MVTNRRSNMQLTETTIHLLRGSSRLQMHAKQDDRRKKSVYFLKEFSSNLLLQIMKRQRITSTISTESLYSSTVRARVLSQSATGNESVLKNCDQFCYNPPQLHFLIAETSSLEFFVPNLGDVLRG